MKTHTGTPHRELSDRELKLDLDSYARCIARDVVQGLTSYPELVEHFRALDAEQARRIESRSRDSLPSPRVTDTLSA